MYLKALGNELIPDVDIGVRAREDWGAAAPFRFGHSQYFRATFPFFGQKSLSSRNLGSERKSSKLLDLTYCQLILFCWYPFQCHFSTA